MADKEGKKPGGFRFSKLKTDENLENEGTWVDYESTFRVKIARIGCRRYKEYMMKAGKPHMRSLKRGEIDNDLADDILRKAIAETILLDWEGLYDDNDNPIPFSKENALTCLNESTDFYLEIFAMAQDRENFKIKDQAIAEKNS